MHGCVHEHVYLGIRICVCTYDQYCGCDNACIGACVCIGMYVYVCLHMIVYVYRYVVVYMHIYIVYV